jgi:hypothetical protein
MVRADGLDALPCQPPDKPGCGVEKLAGRPAHFRSFVSEGVEKPPAVIEGEPPFGFRHAHRLLAIEPRPCVEIGGRDAIGGEGRPFLDGGLILGKAAASVTDKTDRSPFCQFVSSSGERFSASKPLSRAR